MNVLAPFGGRAVYHPSGQDRALGSYTLASGYAANLFRGTPVMLNASTQNLNVAANASDFIGFFHGVEYVDASGVPQAQSFWAAGTTILAGTTIVAWVYSAPETVYEMQCTDTVPATAVGQQINFATAANVGVGDGNIALGQSTTALDAATLTSTLQGMMRIVDVGRAVGNAPGVVGDFTILRVTVARHQFVANKVAV